jgi:hypothetical protein
MDDTNLMPEEEKQLRDALAGAPRDLKEGFCGCWPAVKKLLEWLSGNLPSAKLKAALAFIIRLGEAIYLILDCKAKPEPGAA